MGYLKIKNYQVFFQDKKYSLFQIGCQVQQMATQNAYTFITAD